MAYQMQNVLEVDWEVSASVDLTEVGAHRYSRDEKTVCYQAWFSFHHWATGEVVEVEWRLGWPMPIAVMECLNRGYHIAAHNREFEACIWNNHMVKVHGWPPIPIDAGICTAAVAAANGLPRTLDAVAKVRAYPIKKDTVGNAVMKVIMRNWGEPLARGATIKEYKDGPVLFKFKKGDVPSAMPEVLDRVSDYCRDDVRSENQILKDEWMYPLSPFEYRVWQNDCRINWRGAYIDRVMLEACIQTYELMKQHYALMLMQLSQGRITSAGADAEVLAEARYYNVPMTNNTIEMRADFIASQQTPEGFKNILRCIGALKKTSCSKFYSMRESICEDGRVRGLMMYCGAARTGRWSSRLIQLQNMTGNADLQDSDYEIILEFCRARDYKGLIALFGWKAMDALSWCIRPLICAAPGMEIADADYSAIEARVIAWLAGEEWRLEFFRFTPETWPEGQALYREQVANGTIRPGQWPIKEGSTFKPDVYVQSYSSAFDVPYQQVTKKQRKVGKIQELALGFQGGEGAMVKFGADKLGMSSDDMNASKNKWREASPNIKALWGKMEEAAINAVLAPGYEYHVNGIVSFFVNGPYLHMRLPSGRLLHYYQPEVKFELNNWGKWANKLYYWGRKSDQGGSNEGNKWAQLDTYGGKLTENAVQAIARDLMAAALVRAEANGFNTIFHVHDEMVNEQPEGTTDMKAFIEIMSDSPAWAGDMPVTAAGWIGKRFKKD